MGCIRYQKVARGSDVSMLVCSQSLKATILYRMLSARLPPQAGTLFAGVAAVVCSTASHISSRGVCHNPRGCYAKPHERLLKPAKRLLGRDIVIDQLVHCQLQLGCAHEYAEYGEKKAPGLRQHLQHKRPVGVDNGTLILEVDIRLGLLGFELPDCPVIGMCSLHFAVKQLPICPFPVHHHLGLPLPLLLADTPEPESSQQSFIKGLGG